MRKIVSILVAVLMITSCLLTAESKKVRVLVTTANIRIEARPDSKVIAQAPLGSTFEFFEKIGNWYSIIIPLDETGLSRDGFIHQNVVEELEGAEKQPPLVPVLGAENMETLRTSTEPTAREEPIQLQSPLSIRAKDLDQLAELERKIKTGSIAFLALIKKMQPESIERQKYYLLRK
ncbi:hypothetical protein ACFLRM_06950 [Acidobacteriota bacterium]